MSPPRDEIPKPEILAVWEACGYDPPAHLRDGWAKVRCPVHDDRTPSASLSIELNRWFCHTCDLSEDSIDILMRERGLAFADARRVAAEEFGGSSQEVRAVPRDGGRPKRKSLWSD